MKRHPIEVIEDASAQEGTGSQAKKRAFIEDWFDDATDTRPREQRELWKIAYYALNPWYNYYVVTIPGLAEVASNARKRSQNAKKGKMIFEDQTAPEIWGWSKQFETMFKLLDDLRERRLPPNSDLARSAILEWAKHCGGGSIEIFRRIVQKDLKWGMQASSLNKIYKGWIPAFKVQLAQPFNESKLKFPCYVDPKFDGERCLVFINYDKAEPEVTYFSRNGNPFFNHGCFDQDIARLFKGEGNVVVDCEVIDKAGFQTLMKVPKFYDPNFDTSNLCLVVFDWIPQKHFEINEFDLTQNQRYAHLTKLFKGFQSSQVILVDTRLAKDWQEAENIYEYWVAKGLEGIILKQPEGTYEFKRSDTWMKLKPKKSEDVRIVGMELGDANKRFAGLCGSLIVEREDPDRGTVKINVASGFTDHMHKNIVAVGDQILYTKPDGQVINLKGEVVEVTFDCLTEDGSYRFPRFKRRGDDLIRSDKSLVGQ